MSKYRFGLTTVAFYLIIVLTALLCEGLNGLAGALYVPFTMSELVLLTIGYVAVAGLYYFKEKISNHAKINWFLLPIVTIFFIVGTIGIWRVGNGDYLVNDAAFTYEVPLSQRLTWNMGLFASLAFLYLSVTIFSNRVINIKWTRLFLYMAITAAVAGIIYSLITEMDAYKLIFDPDYEGSYPSIDSFLNNENSYAQLIFYAILAVIMLNAIKPHWWHFIYIGVLYGFLIFSTSFTALFVALLAIIFYYVYKFFTTLKPHTIRNIVVLSIIMVALPIFLGTFFYLYEAEVPFFSRFGNFVKKMILDKDFLTATGRTDVWAKSLAILTSPLDWIFGLGYKNFNYYLGAYYQVKYGAIKYSVDNAFVNVIGQFGLLGIILLMALVGLFGYCCVYCIYKKHNQVAGASLILGMLLFVYGAFESCIPGEGNISGITTFMIVVIPMLVEYHQIKPEKNQTNYSLTHTSDYIYSPSWDESKVTRLVAGILSIPVLVMATSLLFVSDAFIFNAVLLFVFLILLFFMPYMCGVWHKGKSFKIRIARYILLSLLLIVVPLVIAIPTYIYLGITMAVVVFAASFLFTLAFEFIFTLTIGSSISEFTTLVFKYTIKPLIIPIVNYVILFIGIGLIYRFFGSPSLFDLVMFIFDAVWIYAISLPYTINFKNDRIENRFIIDDLNLKYLNKQRKYINRVK